MSDKKYFVPGFRAAAIKAGIRKAADPRNDLALVVCDSIASAAGVFTTNKVKAAPVELTEKRLRAGKARAVLVNAGIANAMTGDEGMIAAKTVTGEVAERLSIPAGQVLCTSTGVIGVQLPLKKILTVTPLLLNKLSPDGFSDFSEAILTTDTAPKIIQKSFKVGARKATILGTAKGAGMIAPNMATMLAFLFTDVAAEPKFLKEVLKETAEETFNRITIDGDTSTNDTLIIMAGGAIKNKPLDAKSRDAKYFREAVYEICAGLAAMVVRDGEGATRVAEISVKGAANKLDAVKAARTIAESPLVKTALCGADPNWGRIAAAAGRSGAKVDQRKLDVKIGGIVCVAGGVPAKNFDEEKVKNAMLKDLVKIEVDLGLGKGEARFLTCDFSKGYIEINAHYRT